MWRSPHTVDHGQWASLEGHPHKLKMYIIGNPLVAVTMVRHDIEAGLDVPFSLQFTRPRVARPASCTTSPRL
jgi:hypothetical protein